MKTNQTSFGKCEVVPRAYWEAGVPYVAGGRSHAGFDCSGLVWYLYHQSGINIPASSSGQATCGTKIPIYEVELGDIVVYEYFNGDFHTGIYVGGCRVIDAMSRTPAEYSGVKIRHLYNDAITLNGLKRIYAARVKGGNLNGWSGGWEKLKPSFFDYGNDANYGWKLYHSHSVWNLHCSLHTRP